MRELAESSRKKSLSVYIQLGRRNLVSVANIATELVDFHYRSYLSPFWQHLLSFPDPSNHSFAQSTKTNS